MGDFSIVVSGVDPRCDAVEAASAVARIVGADIRTIAARLASGQPFFVAQYLDRSAARRMLDDLRAAGARAKPWQANVPLPAEESAPLVSNRVSGPGARSQRPAVPPPEAPDRPAARTSEARPLAASWLQEPDTPFSKSRPRKMPSLHDLDCPLDAEPESIAQPASSGPPPSVRAWSSAPPPPVELAAPVIVRVPTHPAGASTEPARDARAPAISSMRMPAVTTKRDVG